MKKFFSDPTFCTVCLCMLILTTAAGLAQTSILRNENLAFSINPSTLAIHYLQNDKITPIAQGENQTINHFTASPEQLSWQTPHHAVMIALSKDYLEVTIISKDTTGFTFPKTYSNNDAYVIPFHEGKYIPSDDPTWIKQLIKDDHEVLQELSMPFFSTYYQDFAATFIIKNPYNNTLSFREDNHRLILSLLHEQPTTAKNKNFSYRIYISRPAIEETAAVYKNYIKEQGTFKPFAQKQQENPNIGKLYGAPHIYVWGDGLLTLSSIKDWRGFTALLSKELNSSEQSTAKQLLQKIKEAPESSEWTAVWKKIDQPFYNYQKTILLKSLNYLISNGFLTKSQLLESYGLYINQDFGDGNSAYLMKELHNSGIKKAWIGVADWDEGIVNTEFTDSALELGYLIGPYDSYHSVHPAQDCRWKTACFEDPALYDKAAVLNKNGKKNTGFLGVGRKLNPMFSFPEVNYRLNWITGKAAYNSWFIDCDATGEVFDDYTPGRMSSQDDDLKARLKRMTIIRDNYKMVIGSEVGNDYAASTIAFAHGMITPYIYGDAEMRSDKNSPYYVGAYYTAGSSIPSIYSKEISLKPLYTHLNYDMRFNVPLYQLVYNNSVIATHHWSWGTLKVKEQVRNNELKEILYNVPPLYHLNRQEWIKNKDRIIEHVKEFSPLHEKLVQMEMTGFEWLSPDHLIQKTTFKSQENVISIIANFSALPFNWEGQLIPSKEYFVKKENAVQ